MRFVLFVWLLMQAAAAAVPEPKQHFGYEPGTDYKLANYAEIIDYFKTLENSSGRLKLAEFGRSSEGRPMYVAFISDEANLRGLDRYRAISRRLALGQATAAEARALSRDGKAIVWIDSGLHATEVAPAQHAPELAFRMISSEADEVRRIRQNVILMQVPCINPDGLDMVVNWYRKNVGTPYELAPLPFLYQKYSGHDNNRDYFMFNLAETRSVGRLLFHEWFPQIIYNQHQAPPFPARIFVPPYAEPLNPHIPAAVMEGVNLIGAAMKERFAREGKSGVLSYWGYDAWWNGGLRSAPAFHNMHGILTETAGHLYATPRDYKESELPERFGNGMPTKDPGVFYQRPWVGGKWRLRDAIDYMLTADFAILDFVASRGLEFLYKSWEMARANIDAGAKGGPYAYVVSGPAASEMADRLAAAGIDLQSLSKAGGKMYPAGSIVIPAGQPFRSYVIDLMEPQRYPELRAGENGSVKKPYDIAGWTLWMSMGLKVQRIEAPVPMETTAWKHSPPRPLQGRRKIGVYESWMPNSDTGWTEWVLDYYKLPYVPVHNAELQKTDLRSRFDVIVFASQSTDSILHGWRSGERPRRTPANGESPALQRPEYTGGIGVAGVAALDRFVRDGGTLVALDEASDVPVRLFGLPVRALVHNDNYNSPGSLIRIAIEGESEPRYAFSHGGQAWDVTLEPEYNKGDREVRVLARYAAKDLLASGWISGEHVVAGKPILVDARYGSGHVILFGFRPQFRGQTFGTFPLLLKALGAE